MSNKKDKDSKIGGVKPTTKTTSVEGTESVSGVTGVKPTSAVGAAGGVGSATKRRPTRVMSPAEREELFKIINEEADKLFGPDGLPEHQREVVKSAVKMAVAGGILDEEDEPEASPKKKK